MTVQELQELLNNIFSPILKREIMYSGNGFLAVAAREAAAKATAEAEKAAEKTKRDVLQGKTIGVMHGWHSGVTLTVITAMIDLPQKKVAQLIATFEKVKTQYSDKTTPNMPDLKKLSGLDDAELKVLLALLQQH